MQAGSCAVGDIDGKGAQSLYWVILPNRKLGWERPSYFFKVTQEVLEPPSRIQASLRSEGLVPGRGCVGFPAPLLHRKSLLVGRRGSSALEPAGWLTLSVNSSVVCTGCSSGSDFERSKFWNTPTCQTNTGFLEWVTPGLEIITAVFLCLHEESELFEFSLLSSGLATMSFEQGSVKVKWGDLRGYSNADFTCDAVDICVPSTATHPKLTFCMVELGVQTYTAVLEKQCPSLVNTK